MVSSAGKASKRRKSTGRRSNSAQPQVPEADAAGGSSSHKKAKLLTDSPPTHTTIPENSRLNSEHPLLNALIVSKVLEYAEPLTVDDLKNLRLVCQLWNHVSTTKWRETAVVKLVQEPTLFSTTHNDCLTAYELLTFTQNLEQTERPFSGYKFKGFTINIAACDERSDSKIFWDTIGPLVTYVHFEKCVFTGNKDNTFVQLLVRKMPNLTNLVLTEVTFEKKLGKNDGDGRFTENHPFLRTLTLHGEVYDMNGRFHQLAGQSIRLDTLIVTLESGCSAQITLPGSNRDGNIEKLLRSQAETLRTLKIFRPPYNQGWIRILDNTWMTNLTELHLWGTVASSFQFLQFVPNLKVLFVNLGCFEKRNEIKELLKEQPESVQYHKCSLDMVSPAAWLDNIQRVGLTVLHIDHNFRVNSLKKLGTWMPNLKVLRIILSKNGVAVVCQQWKDLTELVCLHGSKIVNANIVCGNGCGRGGTISELEHLERFQLDSICGSSVLTDVSVYNGFMKMPNLKSIQICVGKKMSVQAEEMLMSKLVGNCRIIRNYPDGDHSNYDCCERAEFIRECANGLRGGIAVNVENEDLDASFDSN